MKNEIDSTLTFSLLSAENIANSYHKETMTFIMSNIILLLVLTLEKGAPMLVRLSFSAWG